MKRRLLLMTSFLCLSAFTFLSCDKDPGEDVEPTLDFAIEVKNITYTTADITVTPSDVDKTYYSEIISEEDYNELGETPEIFNDYMAEVIAKLVRETGKTIEEVVIGISLKGVTNYNSITLINKTSYKAFAFEIDAEGKIISDIEIKDFTTPEFIPLTFTIGLENITHTTVDMTVTPSENNKTYYFDTLSEENYDLLGGDPEIFHKFMVDLIAARMEYTEETFEETVLSLQSKGVDSYTPKSLIPGKIYKAFAFEIDAKGKIVSDVKMESFTTLEAISTNEFTIAFSEIGFNGFDYTVTPSNDDGYFAMIYPKDKIDRMNDDVAVAAMIMGEWGFMFYPGSPYIRSGVYENTSERLSHNDTGYYVCILGVESFAWSTPLIKFPIRTLDEADPSACTFEMQINELNSYSINYEIVPSDKKAMFIYDIMTEEDYNTYKDDLTSYADLYIEQYGILNLENLREDGQSGYNGGIHTNVFTPNSTNYIWAAVCNDVGEVNHGVKVHKFTTRQAVVSDATVDIIFGKYFDGDQVAATDPSDFLLGTAKGYAYTIVTTERSESVSNWYINAYEGDLTDTEEATDEEIFKKLVIENSGLQLVISKPFILNWDQPVTFLGIARDENGDYGKVFRSLRTFTKSGISPISEFVKPTQTMQENAISLSLEGFNK